MGSSRIDDVLPSRPGDDSRSYDDLLADGSFHARLANARVERERALAEAGIADESDLLFERRNPWDRHPRTPGTETRGQHWTTRELQPEISEPLILPLRVDEPVPSRPVAQTPKRPIVPPNVSVVTPSPRLPESAARPGRRIGRLAVAGGFLAGLAIGIALAIFTPTWIQSWITVQRVALFGTPGPARAVPTVPPVTLPSDDATVKSEATRPRPAIGGGLALLAAQTLSVSQPGLRLDWIDPIVLEDPPLHYVVWDSPGADLGLVGQSAPALTVPESEPVAGYPR